MQINQWHKDDYEVFGVDARKWIIINKETKETLMRDSFWESRWFAEEALQAYDKMIKENSNAPY